MYCTGEHYNTELYYSGATHIAYKSVYSCTMFEPQNNETNSDKLKFTQ